MYTQKDIYTIDFRDVEYYMEIHPIIKHAMDFPDYYGCNLDALWDCLTDMLGMKLHIEILGLDLIERKFGDTAKKLIDIFKEFKHHDDDRYSDDILIEIVSGDVRIEVK